jgi:hypothetical protein
MGDGIPDPGNGKRMFFPMGNKLITPKVGFYPRGNKDLITTPKETAVSFQFF